MNDLVSTYRIQFHKDFTFSSLQEALPYLHRLGVKTIYASPIFSAVPGSMHGYDVTDPLTINPELGTLQQLRDLSSKVQSLGMFWLQDIVPNHMAFHSDNKWLMDVLENGKASAHYHYFDIIDDGSGKLMVPFLGDALETVVEKNELVLVYSESGFALKYYDFLFPVNLASSVSIIGNTGITSLLSHEINANDAAIFKKKLWAMQHNADVQAHIAAQLKRINSNNAELLQLAAQQHYTLCRWQETDTRINYRRFFTINGMMSLNMQHEDVFNHYHQLIAQLTQEGVFQGLRVDHIDGLYNPTQYLERLRALAGSDTYITVEKILEPGEGLPTYWPVQGTTGYDFLAMVNNLFTNRKSKELFASFYDKHIGEGIPVHKDILRKKRYILQQHMAGDLANLHALLCSLQLVDDNMLHSVPPAQLKEAIGELLVHCPVYRFYGNSFPLDKDEQNAISNILDDITKTNKNLTDAVALLRTILLQQPQSADADYNSRVAQFYMRCMQYSGPLMAKGVEDTLMYTYNRFIVHNEVGDAPESFGISISRFHNMMLARRAQWPLAMNGTATHDTKRGEDARTRLSVLSDIPEQWLRQVEEWQKLSAPYKTANIPDANEEYFIYEALLAAYPMPGTPMPDLTERFKAYIEKAFKEAKRHTNWTSPDAEFGHAVATFIDRLLEPGNPFLQSFEAFVCQVADHGILNSLSQVILKFTCPGLPDGYQGCELWDLSMVDPDNRRPVDYTARSTSLQNNDSVDKLWERRYSGDIKLQLVHRMLSLRAAEQTVFTHGSYLPLKVKGKYKDNIVAYARQAGNTTIVVVLPLSTAAMCGAQACDITAIDWDNTSVVLPAGLSAAGTNVITGEQCAAHRKVNVKDLFNMAHFAVLKYDSATNSRGAGILLPVFSVPSPYGVGDFGKGTRDFVDFLQRAGQKYWQILPLNPTDMSNFHSPYSSVSAMAGNPLLISPDLLAEDGLLDRKELKDYQLPEKSFIDYKKAEKVKYEILELAWQQFRSGEHRQLQQLFEDYRDEQREWLHDYAVYKVLKEKHSAAPWYEWPEEYKWRKGEALAAFIKENAEAITKEEWLQFIFSTQWEKVRHYCREVGIKLVGDMPFYVSYDSVDIWANPHLFSLSDEGKPIGVAGVPPDYFSEDGQLWGMPVFKWDEMKKDDYAWWIARLRKNLELFDLVRLDHFRAFETYWDVPAGEQTARNGKWLPGPRMEFFESARKQLGGLPLIAEDLGYEMEEVYKLRDKTGLPGMKVLQFAFGDNLPVAVDIPHNFKTNCIVYTGTHDNNTTRGWYKNETKKADHKRMREYLGIDVDEDNIHIALARLAYSSVADIAILPMQDVLGLDEKYRMNTPGTIKDNWLWRLSADEITEDIEKHLMDWVMLFGRR